MLRSVKLPPPPPAVVAVEGQVNEVNVQVNVYQKPKL